MAQEVAFDPSGHAETSLKYPDKTSDEVYNRLENFIDKFYGFKNKEAVMVDSVNKTFEINSIMYNALCRKHFPERQPNVCSSYEMVIKVIDKTLKITIQHKEFLDWNVPYYIDFKDLYNNTESNPLIHENEYVFFNRQFNGLLKSIDIAIKTNTLIDLAGTNVEYELYNKNLLKLNKKGIATTSISHTGDIAALHDISMNFINKYFVKPSFEEDTISNTITLHSKIYDVFNRKRYFLSSKPVIINTSYIIKLKFNKNRIDFVIEHTGFEDDDWKPLSIPYEKFINNNSILNASDEDKRHFNKNYNAFLSAFIYYLEKGEMHL